MKRKNKIKAIKQLRKCLDTDERGILPTEYNTKIQSVIIELGNDLTITKDQLPNG